MKSEPVPFRRRPRHAVLAASLALAFGASGAFAQSETGRISDLERKLEQALAQVQALGQRVQQLEGRDPAKAVAAPAAAALAEKVAVLEQQVATVSARTEDDRGLALHGFADVGLAAGSRSRPAGAFISAVDLYLTPKLGDRVKSLIELNFEVGGDGKVGVDLERLQVGYTVADELTLWLGRIHTPYGYWNTAFHHGAQLQSSITRPRFLDFEDNGGILPSHTVGLWGTGKMRVGSGRLGYDVYAGNSPTIEAADAGGGAGSLDPGLRGAADRSAIIGGNLSYAFGGALDGLTVGVHALTSRVVDTLAEPNRTRLSVAGPWFTYLENDWEILGEYYGFRNKDLSGKSGTHGSSAGYLQLGYTAGTLTPFARYERASLDQADNYFAQQESGRSYDRVSAGVRYDLNPAMAIKLEAGRTSQKNREPQSYTEIRSQFAFRF